MNTTFGDGVAASAAYPTTTKPARSADLKQWEKSISYKNYISVRDAAPGVGQPACASLACHESPEKSFSCCVVVRAAGAQVEHKKHPNVGTGRASLKCHEGR